jgi:hypothetical protein
VDGGGVGFGPDAGGVEAPVGPVPAHAGDELPVSVF